MWGEGGQIVLSLIKTCLMWMDQWIWKEIILYISMTYISTCMLYKTVIITKCLVFLARNKNNQNFLAIILYIYYKIDWLVLKINEFQRMNIQILRMDPTLLLLCVIVWLHEEWIKNIYKCTYIFYISIQTKTVM